MKGSSKLLIFLLIALFTIATIGGSVLASDDSNIEDDSNSISEDINDSSDDSYGRNPWDDDSDHRYDDSNDKYDDSDDIYDDSDDIYDDSNHSGKGKFSDVDENHWAYWNIKKAWELGLVSGYEDGKFLPNKALKAEDTMVFLDRIMYHHDLSYLWMDREQVEDRLRDRDRDQDRDKWYYENMVSISSKLSDETLDTLLLLGEKPVTRELLAQMLYEITEGALPQIKDIPSYKDIQNSPYKKALEYVAKVGLMGGTSSTEMSPLKPVTRGELMTILIRIDDDFDDEIFDHHRGKGSDDHDD